MDRAEVKKLRSTTAYSWSAGQRKRLFGFDKLLKHVKFIFRYNSVSWTLVDCLDHILKFLVSQVITSLLVAAVIYIIQQGGEFFLAYLCIFSLISTFLLVVIYPMFIAPLFDTFLPLPEGQLRAPFQRGPGAGIYS